MAFNSSKDINEKFFQCDSYIIKPAGYSNEIMDSIWNNKNISGESKQYNNGIGILATNKKEDIIEYISNNRIWDNRCSIRNSNCSCDYEYIKNIFSKS